MGREIVWQPRKPCADGPVKALIILFELLLPCGVYTNQYIGISRCRFGILLLFWRVLFLIAILYSIKRVNNVVSCYRPHLLRVLTYFCSCFAVVDFFSSRADRRRKQ